MDLQRIFGITIFLLLGALVTVKRIATGSIFERPKGSLLVQFVNIYNLIFLLVATPLAAELLIRQYPEFLTPIDLGINLTWFFIGLGIVGVGLYVLGCCLMAWALITLGRNYQLGGTFPRMTDKLIIAGPYHFVRHPMYTAVLCMSLGLTCLLHSIAYFALFCIYLVLVLLLIPIEEKGLHKSYNKQYLAYQQNVKKLVPFLF